MMLLMLMTFSMGAWATNVTFSLGTSAGKDISSSSGTTKENVTVSFANGSGTALSWQTDHVRFYHSGSKVTISSTTANITGIVIDAKSGYTNANLKVGSTSITANDAKTQYSYSPSSPVSSVTISNDGSAQARLTNITVTIAGGDPDPGVGGGDPDSGDGGDDATPIVLDYSNLVGIANAKTIFYESFNTNDGTGGNDNQWSGSIASNTAKYDNVGWTVANEGGADECLKLGTGSKKGSAETPAINASGDFILTFRAAAWGTSDGTTLNLSATNATVGVSSVTMRNASFSDYAVMITNATANFKIKFEAKNTSNNRFFIDEVKVIPVTTVSVTTTEGYSTFYSDKAIIMPKNLAGSTANVVGNNLSWSWEYAEGESVPAGTPILVKGNDGVKDYLAMESSSNESAPATNYLVANATAAAAQASVLAPTASKFYVLSYNTNNENLGFYWLTADGSSFEVPVGKVFLAVPAGVGAAKAFVLDSEVDGIETIENVTVKNNAAYNLNGQRVNANAKGIVIVNGKKYLNK